MDLLNIFGYYSTACVYSSFRWGPFVYSIGIVQWNFTRRDHPGNPGRVSESGSIKKTSLVKASLMVSESG